MIRWLFGEDPASVPAAADVNSGSKSSPPVDLAISGQTGAVQLGSASQALAAAQQPAEAKSSSPRVLVVLPGAGVDLDEVSCVALCFRGRLLFMVVYCDKAQQTQGVAAHHTGRDLAVEALLGVEEGENGRPVPRLALLEWREDRCRAVPFRDRGCGRAPSGSLFVDLALFCAAHCNEEGREHPGVPPERRPDPSARWGRGMRASFLAPSAFVHKVGGAAGREGTALAVLGVGCAGELPRLVLSGAGMQTTAVPGWFADLSRVFHGECLAVMVCSSGRVASEQALSPPPSLPPSLSPSAGWVVEVLRAAPFDDVTTLSVPSGGGRGEEEPRSATPRTSGAAGAQDGSEPRGDSAEAGILRDVCAFVCGALGGGAGGGERAGTRRGVILQGLIERAGQEARAALSLSEADAPRDSAARDRAEERLRGLEWERLDVGAAGAGGAMLPRTVQPSNQSRKPQHSTRKPG
ncbi:hypothetical protein T484DRAFT_2017341 [Baffinella frigidus]|nr:hypothetical protein T484DRAFT_2017341 [Cryptophyta sp. CCMP2293]